MNGAVAGGGGAGTRCTCYAARSRGDLYDQRKAIILASSWYKLPSGATTSKAKTKTSKLKTSK